MRSNRTAVSKLSFLRFCEISTTISKKHVKTFTKSAPSRFLFNQILRLEPGVASGSQSHLAGPGSPGGVSRCDPPRSPACPSCGAVDFLQANAGLWRLQLLSADWCRLRLDLLIRMRSVRRWLGRTQHSSRRKTSWKLRSRSNRDVPFLVGGRFSLGADTSAGSIVAGVSDGCHVTFFELMIGLRFLERLM